MLVEIACGRTVHAAETSLAVLPHQLLLLKSQAIFLDEQWLASSAGRLIAAKALIIYNTSLHVYTSTLDHSP